MIFSKSRVIVCPSCNGEGVETYLTKVSTKVLSVEKTRTCTVCGGRRVVLEKITYEKITK